VKKQVFTLASISSSASSAFLAPCGAGGFAASLAAFSFSFCSALSLLLSSLYIGIRK